LSQDSPCYCFRLLNLAFAHLQHALRESYPCLVIVVASAALDLIDFSDEQSHGRAVQLYRILFNYIHQLSVVHLGPGHPLAKIWLPLSQSLLSADSRYQLRVVTRLIKDDTKKYFMFDAELVYQTHEHCWRIEADANFVDYNEAAGRDMPKLLSAIESREPPPKHLWGIIYRLKLRLSKNPFQAREDKKEVHKIVSEIVADPSTDRLNRLMALSFLSNLEAARGNWGIVEDVRREALELSDWLYGIASCKSIQFLRGIVDVLPDLGINDAVARARTELEYRMRLAEEAVGIGTLEEVMRELP
jgi:hypothetical protein